MIPLVLVVFKFYKKITYLEAMEQIKKLDLDFV